MIRIELFGQIRCLDGEQPLQIPYKQCGWLLARLASELGPRHERSKIASELWPDLDSIAAQVNLRKALHSLSSSLKPDVLCRDRRYVWLNTAMVVTDIDDFRYLLRSANDPFDMGKFDGQCLLSGVVSPWADRVREDLLKLVGEVSFRLDPRAAESLAQCLTIRSTECRKVVDAEEPWDAFEKLLNWQVANSPRDLADFLWGARSTAFACGPARISPIWESLIESRNISNCANGLGLLYLGNARLWSGRQWEALNLLSRCIEIFRGERQEEMLDLALSTHVVAALQTLDYDLARRNIILIKDPVSRTNLTALYYWNQFQLPDAITNFERLDRMIPSCNVGLQLQNAGNLALTNQEIGRVGEANRWGLRVSSLKGQTQNSRLSMFSDQIDALRNRNLGNVRKSLSTLETCIARSRKDNLSWPSIQEDASDCCLELGNVDRALDYFVESAVIRRKAAVGLSAPVIARTRKLKRRLVDRLGREGYSEGVNLRLRATNS